MKLAIILFIALLSGCATTYDSDSSFMFPHERSSRIAETAWLTMHTIDTMQTVQIAKHPDCYYEANPLAAAMFGSKHPDADRVVVMNILTAALHSRVSSWLDDKVSRAQLRNDDSVGPWYVGRVAWHTISILGTGLAIVNNYDKGLNLTSAVGCR